MIPLYLLGLLIYIISVYITYSDKIKQSPYYFYIGISLSMVCSFLWMYIAKHSSGKQLYLNGIYWDSMIVGCYSLIPVLAFGVRMSSLNFLGVFLVLVGIFLTKV